MRRYLAVVFVSLALSPVIAGDLNRQDSTADVGALPSPLVNPSQASVESTVDPSLAGGLGVASSEPTYITRVDVMWLQILGNGSHAVPRPSFGFITDDPSVRVSNMSDQRYRAVPRITLGEVFQDGSGWELTYFGRSDWNREASNLFVQSGGFREFQDSTLTTKVHSGEVNFLSATDQWNGPQLLAGFRVLSFNERLYTHLNVNDFDADSAVTNTLIGAQLGARQHVVRGRWNLFAEGKAGVYGNSVTSHQQSLLNNDQGTVRSGRASFVGELGINATYRFNDHWTYRLGYNCFWIEGIARAADQFTPSGPLTSITAHDHAFLHGPSTGLECQF